MPEACKFMKKETLAQVFSMDFEKFLRTFFLQKTSGRPLLNDASKNSIARYIQT